MTWLRSILIGVACAALFYSTSLAAVNSEHTDRQVEHPCGEPGLDMGGLTGFFHFKWQADFRDLNDRSVQIWLRHHGLEHTEITVVRLFRSRKQPTVGVVHGRRFVNYLNGSPLVDILCIVKINDNHVVQYPMEEIEEILRSGGEDT